MQMPASFSVESMPIESVELHRLRVPLTVPYKLSFGPVTHFDTVVVEMRDGAGNYGFGEATPLTGYTEETIESVWALASALAATLPGVHCAAVEQKLAQRLDTDPFAATAFLSAAEMLQGCELLRITEPTRVPLLGLLNAVDEAAIEKEVDTLLALGYRTLKVKVGFALEADAQRVRCIQRIVANRATLRLDANQGYDREQGCRFAAGLAPEGIELFEQPCAAADWDSAVAVARVSTVPMMLDESIYGIDDIQRAAELSAARYIKLKLMKFGGLARLERGLSLIRRLGMEPVLGNGVACEIGCWMEACVARTTIANAGEMNGWLKTSVGLFEQAPRLELGALVLDPGQSLELSRDALQRTRVAHQIHG
jgi:L-alanine-DL-glutamate epimerase-like enolase superfamily enzyme